MTYKQPTRLLAVLEYSGSGITDRKEESMYIYKLRKAEHNCYFFTVYRDSFDNNGLIMTAYDTWENILQEMKYWNNKFITG